MTPREKRIRNQFGAMFVAATLTSLWLMVMRSNQSIENERLKGEIALFDSLYVKSGYIEDTSIKARVNNVFEDANAYREVYSDIFELKTNEMRYESALESYVDTAMHQELYERDGFKSAFTQEERVKAADEIRSFADSYNNLVAYSYVFDEYRRVHPAITREIERFLFFTE
jgi:hypothetical protein